MNKELLANARKFPTFVPEVDEIRDIFGYCLKEAEGTFGERDRNLNRTVCLRKDERRPQTICDDGNQVTIWLSKDRSRVGYFYEAAHEAVHSLGPDIPKGPGSYLEEAIATVFSLRVVCSVFGPEGVMQTTVTPNYQHAISMVSKIDNDTIALGQQLRRKAGTFSRVSANDIKELWPEVNESDILLSLSAFPEQ